MFALEWPAGMTFNDPSEEIRLLELLPLDLSGKLRGRSRNVSLDERIDFVAFSYACCTRMSERLLSLDTDHGSFDMQIHQNLDNMLIGLHCCDVQTLPQLWDATGCLRPMWIDMICINQENMHEKAIQIGLMGNIFRSASLVVVWIEESNSELRYAFHYLRRLARAKHDIDEEECWRMFDPIGWASVRQFLKCSWFQRRWVIQEATLNQRVVFICGTTTLNIEDLFVGVNIAVKTMVRRPRHMKRTADENAGSIWPLHMLERVRYNNRNLTHPPQLLSLLERFNHTMVSHSHDYLYSMFALCSKEEVALNPIRYDEPAEHVFQLFVISHFELYRDVDFLPVCRALQDPSTEGTMTVLPSWVPNWSTNQVRRMLGVANANDDSKFFKAGLSMSAKFQVDRNVAIVSGIVIDRIASIDDCMSLYKTADIRDRNSDVFVRLVKFWLAKPWGETSYASEDARFQSLINTMTLYSIQVPSEEDQKPQSLRSRFQTYFSGTRTMEVMLQRGYQAIEADGSPLGFALTRLLNWRAFLTTRGFLGLARPGCQVDDEVCVIAGSSVPILLSRVTDAHRQVKGEVVLDGFMFGEAESMVQSGELSVQDFALV